MEGLVAKQYKGAPESLGISFQIFVPFPQLVTEVEARWRAQLHLKEVMEKITQSRGPADAPAVLHRQPLVCMLAEYLEKVHPQCILTIAW